MVICFQPGKLGTKPDSLTRRWDVYPKEGSSDYARVNLHNFRPVFTNEQLAPSLPATRPQVLILCALIIMDTKQLHSDILSTLHSDPISAKHLDEPSPGWSLDSNSFLRHKTHICPECEQSPTPSIATVSRPPAFRTPTVGQNKTLDLIQCTYSWLLLRTLVQDYCKSCTVCMHAKLQRHKPYGLLKQLPIPEQPWNSISMDFIKKAP
jgi:Integrase zinc binding domain